MSTLGDMWSYLGVNDLSFSFLIFSVSWDGFVVNGAEVQGLVWGVWGWAVGGVDCLSLVTLPLGLG